MKLRYSLMVSLCLLALPGCQSRPQETSAAPTVASETTAAQPDSGKTSTESAQNESKSPSESSVDLKELTDLVGKTDSEVTAVLGQGEEMKNGASRRRRRCFPHF